MATKKLLPTKEHLISLGSGFFLFFILLVWLDFHGYFISPDAIYLNVLAKSFWQHPYIIWFKRAFSYPYEIIHPDFTFPPLGPLVHWFLENMGVTTWHRGNWITAFFMGMTIPAWFWAFLPHFENQKTMSSKKSKGASLSALLAAWVATVLLLAQSQNQMWQELYLGIVSPVVVFLFILTYGAYLRKRYHLCGILIGTAFLIRFDAQVTLAIFVLGHLASTVGTSLKTNVGQKKWRAAFFESFQMIWPFLVTTSPWWVRSIFLGHTPWFNHMVPIFLYGEAGNFRWFADTDTAIGHPITNTPVEFYLQLLDARWTDLIHPYLGGALTPIAYPWLLLSLGLVYALKRPAHKALLAFTWIGAILRLLVVAGLHDAFNRRYFLIFDACAITWLTLMLWDKNRWIKAASVGTMILLVVTNWDFLQSSLQTMRPSASYLEVHSPGISQAVKILNTTKEPVLAAQIVGHAIAYYTDQIPIIELPTNYADPGMMDLFMRRWKIKWTTEGGLAPHLKEFKLIARDAHNGYGLFEVIAN